MNDGIAHSIALALDRIATVLERQYKEQPPCGGARCYLDKNGEWIHSSKSYDCANHRDTPPYTTGPR